MSGFVSCRRRGWREFPGSLSPLLLFSGGESGDLPERENQDKKQDMCAVRASD